MLDWLIGKLRKFGWIGFVVSSVMLVAAVILANRGVDDDPEELPP